MGKIKETKLGSAECPLRRPFESPLQYDRQSTYLIVFVVITARLLREQNTEKYSRNFSTYFDVSLTVHFSITLDNDQLNAQIFNTFIAILYMYMFRAISCSSSGGQIVLTQHLVSSLTESDNTRCCLLIQFDLLKMSKILLETCTCTGS
jgi:hypothetical protein